MVSKCKGPGEEYQEEHTNTESNDKDSDSKERNLTRDVERLHHTWKVGRNNTTGEGDDEACKRNNHSDVPLEQLGPVLRVFRVILLKGHKFIIFHVAIFGRNALGYLSGSRFSGVFLEVCVNVQFTKG